MGKFALLLAATAALAGLSSDALSGRGALASTMREAATEYRVLARSAAQAGVVRAEQRLLASFTTSSMQATFDGIPYTTTIDVAGEEALITSTGSASVPGSATPATFQVMARVKRSGGGDTPPFATYAVAVNGNLSLSGSGSLATYGSTSTDPEQANIRVHTNGILDVGSAATRVHGYGTYTTGVSGKTTNTFQPQSPTRQPLSQADSVQIPRITPQKVVAAYGATATVYKSVPGDSYAGRIENTTLPGGTRDNPKVYHIQGNALLTNVTVNGYAVFVADGRVDLSGVVQGTPNLGLAESAISIFTPGEITMGGGTTAYASLFGGSMSFKGTVDIWGNLVAGGNFTNGGGATIHYHAPAPKLYRAYGTGDPAFTLLAYRER